MSLLDNMTILRRIGLIAGLPLIAALGFGATILLSTGRDLGVARQIAQTAELGPLFGGFVHEAQIERGLTVSWLKSTGDAPLAEKRKAQIARTDAAAQSLRDKVRARAGDGDDLAPAVAEIARLPGLRADAEQGRLGADEAIRNYSTLIAASLAPVEDLTRSARLSETARAIIAYGALLRAKEYAGQERATGARGFSPSGFAREVYPRFAALAAMQDEQLSLARRYAAPETAAKIAAFAESAPQKNLAGLRGQAEAAALHDGAGLENAVWFAAATARIEALKALEDALAQGLSQTVNAEADTARLSLIVAAALIAGVALAVGLLSRVAALSIARPLGRVTSSMSALTQGDLAASQTGLDPNRRDEFGILVRALEIFRETARAREGLESQAREERRKELARQTALSQSVEHFRARVGDVIETVTREATEMNGSSAVLTEAAHKAEQAGAAARGEAAGSSSNVQTVSAAAEQLSHSLTEVTNQMRDASARIGQAAKAARGVDAQVGGLAQMTDKIGAIVDAIRSIAAQTNLLALNATIEAARAGEAGKGFAVVASEVKTLAGGAARATDEIAGQIGGIQRAMQDMVEDIRSMTVAFEEIDQLASSVSDSVEQQSAATGEIADAISAASASTARSSASVEVMTGIIVETSREAERVSTATGLLTDSSGKLSAAVEQFFAAMVQDVAERRIAVRKASTQGLLLLARGARIQTRLVDISDTGARIVAPSEIHDGDILRLEFEDQTQVPARVVWLRDGFAGLRFDRPLGGALVKSAA
jgi:methyl-accepting chemotaxis protein